MNEIRAITTFIRAATLGSLRRAAVDQGISPQAASHAVMQLEKELGVRLFHRTTRKLSLTEEGQRFFESVQPAVSMLAAALDDARRARQEIAGPLRISAPRTLGRPMLWQPFCAFAERYPDVQLDVQFDDRFTDLVAERADVGFRGGSPPAAGSIARRLMPIQLIVCASPDYLARHGAPASIDDLARHRCTGYRRANTGKLALWEFQLGDETVYRDVPAAFCANDTEAEAEAVLTGYGIGQLASFTAVPPIRAGRLVPLLTPYVAQRESIYVYYRHRTEQPLRVRTFIDFMVERLADNPAFRLTDDELRDPRLATRRGLR
ncbi:LysR family transcriptional regulator [Burkholderia sp. WAC0059]|uniref:LysR family transcriptional regulator n=1 Tax=Burkholderia sp. WAC0059 TaxID=2066022 RepID=UPI000C7E903F|nr:LysR family transcriptional regulator [Burkholderia sp. WAC0059]PLZ02959.1 LysR family transcriptional regulator [Burkholderia sp. WAC0059]